MSDKLLRSKEPKISGGVKQPGNCSTLQGPTYPEAQGKSSNIWSSNTPGKKSKTFVRG